MTPPEPQAPMPVIPPATTPDVPQATQPALAKATAPAVPQATAPSLPAGPHESLAARLARINQLTLLTAIGIIALIVTVSSFSASLATLVGSTEAQGRLLAENASASLQFEDAASAGEMLLSLRHTPEVQAAALYGRDLRRFAHFTSGALDAEQRRFAFDASAGRELPEKLASLDESFAYDLQIIRLTKPVAHLGQTVGALHLIVDLQPLYRQLVWQMLVTLAAALLALLLARFLSRRLSVVALRPLGELTALMEQVATRADYSLRAGNSSFSELDTLANGLNGMLCDIQARDESLQLHREHLEEMVEKRTAELRASMEEAKAASKAKSQFLATMSHEIRTPMNGVLGMTELMLGTHLDGTQQRYAESVLKSGRHLLGIINDILDFSKIESGHLELESVQFDLGELAEDTVAMFVQQAEEKGIELAVQLSPPNTPLLLRGDPFRLRQVLTNLLGNALKFTRRGQIVVRVQVLAAGAGKSLVNLSVEDTGVGIAPEARERIFEQFVQADGSTTRQFGGTGLGLAICRNLIGMMGGSIGVDSELGKGSRFWVKLSLPKAADAPGARAPLADLEGVRVLVVDDNLTNLEILQLQLGGWGMRVSCAESGEQALDAMCDAAAAGTPFELAILDMHMPRMDGLQLARLIRDNLALSSTRLIMLTSTYLAGSSAERERAGIMRCVNKPIRQSELYEVVVQALTASELAAPALAGWAGGGPGAVPAEPLHGHVLLAEDNPVNQEVARAMLLSLGVAVDIVGNGEEALAMAAAQPFDLVLMDCHMPVMDGYQATALLRQREAAGGRRLPVVALTANAMEGDRQQCLNAGMDDYLAKPYSKQQLEHVLRRWLPAAAAAAAAPAGVGGGGVAAASAASGVTPAGAATVVPADSVGAAVARAAEAPATGVSIRPDAMAAPAAGVEAPAAPAPEPAAAAIEARVLDQYRELDPAGGMGLACQIMRIYLDSSRDSVQQVEAAIAAGDADALRRAAHTLKSSSANVGALALSQAFRALETAGKEGRVEAAAPLFAAARAEYERALAELRAYLAQSS